MKRLKWKRNFANIVFTLVYMWPIILLVVLPPFLAITITGDYEYFTLSSIFSLGILFSSFIIVIIYIFIVNRKELRTFAPNYYCVSDVGIYVTHYPNSLLIGYNDVISITKLKCKIVMIETNENRFRIRLNNDEYEYIRNTITIK